MWPIGDCGWHCLLQHSSLAAVEPGSHRAWVQVLDMEWNGRQRLSDLSLWFSQEGSLSPCLSTVPFQVTVEGCCTYFQYANSIQPAAPQTRPHWEKPGRGTLSGAPTATLTSQAGAGSSTLVPSVRHDWPSPSSAFNSLLSLGSSFLSSKSAGSII